MPVTCSNDSEDDSGWVVWGQVIKAFAKGSWDPEQGRDTTNNALEINGR